MKKFFILLFIGLCFASAICAGENLVVSQGETISEELQQLLKVAESRDVWGWKRAEVIDELAKRGDRAAIPTLLKLTKSKVGLVRMHTVEALGVFGDTRAIPALQIIQAQDEDYTIKEAAARVLIKLKASLEVTQKNDAIIETHKEEIKQEVRVAVQNEAETDPLKSLNNTLLFQTERRDPATACFLSMATLGGGQIYNYQPKKAIVAYIIGGLSLIGIFSNNQTGIIIGGTALLGTWTWSVFDSYNSAVDINIGLEKKYKIGVSFRY